VRVAAIGDGDTVSGTCDGATDCVGPTYEDFSTKRGTHEFVPTHEDLSTDADLSANRGTYRVLAANDVPTDAATVDGDAYYVPTIDRDANYTATFDCCTDYAATIHSFAYRNTVGSAFDYRPHGQSLFVPSRDARSPRDDATQSPTLHPCSHWNSHCTHLSAYPCSDGLTTGYSYPSSYSVCGDDSTNLGSDATSYQRSYLGSHWGADFSAHGPTN
jgi:hypothetical protein